MSGAIPTRTVKWSPEVRATESAVGALTPAPGMGEVTALALSIKEVCQITGLGRSYVYGAIRNNALLARKAGRRTIILRHDLEEFLANLPAAGGR